MLITTTLEDQQRQWLPSASICRWIFFNRPSARRSHSCENITFPTHSCGLRRGTTQNIQFQSHAVIWRSLLFKTASRKFRNLLPCNGLVNMSPTISSVGQYSTVSSFAWIRSVTKKIPYVNVPCSPTTRSPAVLLEQDCAFVVLKHLVLTHFVSLRFQEVTRP